MAGETPYQDGWSSADDGEAGPPVADAPEPRLDDYRPLGRRADLARISLLLVSLASVIAVVFDAAERSMQARVGSGKPVTFDELAASEDRQVAIAAAQGCLWIIAAIFFIAWLYRAYRNLNALGVERLRYGPGWAIGSWFVPILNLFRPKQIVNDVWRGSHPLLADRTGWRDTPVPRTLDLWWAAYLLVGAAFGVAERLAFSAKDSDAAALSSAVYIAADFMTVAAGVLALVVVDRTTARQAARVAVLGGADHPGGRVHRWLLGRRRLAAAAAVCGAAAAVGVLTIALQSSGSTVPVEDAGAAQPPPATSNEFFAFTDDFSDPGTDWSEEETADASVGYERGAYSMTVTTPQLSWFSLYSLGVVTDHIRLEADATLERPASDEAAVGIACFATDVTGYVAGIWPDGYYAIGLDPEDSENIALLADGSAPEAIRGVGEVNRIGIECTSGPPGVVTLTVNGRTLAQARHDEGVGSFQIAGLSVFAGPGPATGWFDNFVASTGAG